MTCLFLDWTFVDMHIVPHLDARGLMCLALTSKSFTQPEIAAALKKILARSLRESLEKIPGRNFIAAIIPVKFAGPRWGAFRLELKVRRVCTRDIDWIVHGWKRLPGWERHGPVTHLSWITLVTFKINAGVMVMETRMEEAPIDPGYNIRDPKERRHTHIGFGPLPHPAGPAEFLSFLHESDILCMIRAAAAVSSSSYKAAAAKKNKI